MECNVFEEGRQYGDSIVQAIAPRGQNSGGGCFLQFLVADRRVHYRSPRIVEYMPHYRVADPCVWDLAVALTIGLAIWRASRPSQRAAG
jgi:hypothetical protein